MEVDGVDPDADMSTEARGDRRSLSEALRSANDCASWPPTNELLREGTGAIRRSKGFSVGVPCSWNGVRGVLKLDEPETLCLDIEEDEGGG